MKRAKLEKKLRPDHVKRGKRHDLYCARDGRHVAVPRHRDINEHTARAILARAATIGILAGLVVALAQVALG